jgi:hypothetical protein
MADMLNYEPVAGGQPPAAQALPGKISLRCAACIVVLYGIIGLLILTLGVFHWPAPSWALVTFVQVLYGVAFCSAGVGALSGLAGCLVLTEGKRYSWAAWGLLFNLLLAALPLITNLVYQAAGGGH